MTRGLLVALFASLSACASSPQDGSVPIGSLSRPIVAGTVANASAYPGLAAFIDTRASGNPVFCSGTLITRRAVLSAAHCFGSVVSDPGRVKVVLGAADARTAGPRLDVKRILLHPAWKGFGSSDPDGLEEVDDLALVELAGEAEAEPVDYVLPADVTDLPEPKAMVTLVGYGVTSTSGSGSSGVLHEGQAVVRAVRAKVFLAGGEGTSDSCRFDSGGPVFATHAGARYVIGVTSREWAGSTRKCGDGGVYTAPAAYRGWIESTIGALPSPVATDADAGSTTMDVGPTSEAPVGAAPSTGGCTAGGRAGDGLVWLVLAALVAARAQRIVASRNQPLDDQSQGDKGLPVR